MGWNLPMETTVSARAREDAAEGWLDAATFEALLSPETRRNGTLMQCLQAGSVLGIWISEWKLYLFPQWQIAPTGQPLKGLSQVLALLRGPFGISNGEMTSGWQELEWLIAPHALLSGGTPAGVLALDPDLVLKAAEQDFSPWSAEGCW